MIYLTFFNSSITDRICIINFNNDRDNNGKKIMKADNVKAQTVMNHLNIRNFKIWHCFEEGRGDSVTWF